MPANIANAYSCPGIEGAALGSLQQPNHPPPISKMGAISALTFALHLDACGHAVESTALHKAPHICSHLLQQGCHRPAVNLEIRACVHPTSFQTHGS